MKWKPRYIWWGVIAACVLAALFEPNRDTLLVLGIVAGIVGVRYVFKHPRQVGKVIKVTCVLLWKIISGTVRGLVTIVRWIVGKARGVAERRTARKDEEATHELA